jgi:hypothetical protein
MKRLVFAASVFSLCLLPFPTLAVPIDFVSTLVDPSTQTVQVTVQFRETPNFFVVDQFGRQQDSFQFFGFDEPRADDLGLQGGYVNVTSITRGEEIHFGEGLLMREPLTDTLPADPTAFTTRSGGWGGTIETVPFVQDGQTLTYTASLLGLGDTNGNGHFGFGVETYRFGATTLELDDRGNGFTQVFFGQCASDTVCRIPTQSVPEPDTLWLTVIGMIGLAGLVAWRQRGARLS